MQGYLYIMLLYFTQLQLKYSYHCNFRERFYRLQQTTLGGIVGYLSHSKMQNPAKY